MDGAGGDQRRHRRALVRDVAVVDHQDPDALAGQPLGLVAEAVDGRPQAPGPVGDGADAICPGLALETVGYEADQNDSELTGPEAQQRLQAGLEDGVLK
ncbi:MAG TPA: hypothetical protein VG455_08730, partial [Acidimicrobiales bacterium]|nr:hypothetical protein [Acidimicrobiales bacterium]